VAEEEVGVLQLLEYFILQGFLQDLLELELLFSLEVLEVFSSEFAWQKSGL